MLILILIFGEIFAYANELMLGAKLNNGKLFAPYQMRIKKFEERYNDAKAKDLGKEYGKEYKNKPIVLFGGSYAYGYGLEDKDRFPYVLSEYTKRPVYNRAYQTWSVQNMLWQLKRDDFYAETKQPEWIIYTGVNIDFDNMYNPDILNGLRYYKKGNELAEVPYLLRLADNSYLYRKIKMEISYRKAKNTTQSIKDFNKHVLEAKKEISKHWQGVKMAVVLYDKDKTEDFSELEKNNIKVISLKEFMEKNIFPYKEYRNSEADKHPNGDAWRKIVPEIVSQLGI